MNKQIILVIVFAVIIIGGGVVLSQKKIDTPEENASYGEESQITPKKEKVVMYKSPNCGCCVGYAKFLRDKGFDVEVVISDDMSGLKDKYGISGNMRSCHTIAMGDYFVEGHVPMEAVKKMLDEKPDIDGITLPGMPSGTPGMPGSKREPYIIYQILNGESSEYMTI